MNLLLRQYVVKRLAWAYTAMIVLLVVLPLNGQDQFLGNLNDNYILQIRFDYISHALLFVPWVLLVGYGWELRRKNRLWIGLSFLLAQSFAAFCEYLQLLLPYRTFNINDLLANALGVTLGYSLLYCWIRFDS